MENNKKLGFNTTATEALYCWTLVKKKFHNDIFK